MSIIRSLTYQQSIFKRYHSDQHFSEFLPTRWRQKSTGIDTETVTKLRHGRPVYGNARGAKGFHGGGRQKRRRRGALRLSNGRRLRPIYIVGQRHFDGPRPTDRARRADHETAPSWPATSNGDGTVVEARPTIALNKKNDFSPHYRTTR